MSRLPSQLSGDGAAMSHTLGLQYSRRRCLPGPALQLHLSCWLCLQNKSIELAEAVGAEQTLQIQTWTWYASVELQLAEMDPHGSLHACHSSHSNMHDQKVCMYAEGCSCKMFDD